MSFPPANRFDVASRSDVGRVRTSNQDEYGEAERAAGRWFIVADGMGGHAGGATAARLAVEQISAETVAGADPAEQLETAFVTAHRKIRAEAQADSRLAGMGTTAVALAFEGAQAWIANVGDSRIYRLRGSVLEQLTRDHSVVAEFVRRGYISEEQAREHPRRNELLRSLGSREDVEVDVDAIDAAPGDTFLLCSDGLHGIVTDASIATMLAMEDASSIAEALVDAANAAGSPDNVTVQVVRIPDTG